MMIVKKNLDREFKAAYNIRNAFVHSSDVLKVITEYNKEQLGKFVNEIQSYIRKAIKNKLNK